MFKSTTVILVLLSAASFAAPDLSSHHSGNIAFASDTGKTDPATPARSSLKVGLTYSNNSVYLARTDSVATPAFGAGLTYTLKSGIFFAGSLSYLPSRQFDKLDAGNLEAGYNFNVDNLSGGVSVSKYFASFNSTQVISALDATVGAELSYDLFGVVTPAVHADYALLSASGGNDLILTAGLGHEFELEKVFVPGDRFSIEPKAGLTSGTQNFISTYYVKKKQSGVQRQQHQNGNAKGKGLSKISTSTTLASVTNTPVSSSTNRFQTLAYEFTLPISYSVHKVGITMVPTYAVAVHKIADDGTNTTYLPDSSVFYVQVGVSYTF